MNPEGPKPPTPVSDAAQDMKIAAAELRSAAQRLVTLVEQMERAAKRLTEVPAR